MSKWQLRPPRDASPSWYQTVALASMRQHGAIFLSPFSHRLTESLDNHEYQRLRCRVNFHALRFREDVMELSSKIVSRLRAEGQFLAIHLRFELDMLAFAGWVWSLCIFDSLLIYRSIIKEMASYSNLKSLYRRLLLLNFPVFWLTILVVVNERWSGPTYSSVHSVLWSILEFLHNTLNYGCMLYNINDMGLTCWCCETQMCGHLPTCRAGDPNEISERQFCWKNVELHRETPDRKMSSHSRRSM